MLGNTVDTLTAIFRILLFEREIEVVGSKVRCVWVRLAKTGKSGIGKKRRTEEKKGRKQGECKRVM